jgi:hypothetical protein
MHTNSWNRLLWSMEVGERRYFDTTAESYPNDMRTMNTPRSRRPEAMRDMEFTTSLFTAVSATRVGEVRLLICLERTA